MDDYQVILYIIFGIIYFIFNLLKKKAKPPATLDDEAGADQGEQAPSRRGETVTDPFDETVGRPQQRPASYEELLGEFESAASEAGKKAEEKVKKVQQYEQSYEASEDAPDTTYSDREAERRMRETEARKALQEKASAAERAQATEHEVNRELQENRELEARQEEPERARGGASQHQNQRRKQLLEMLKDPEKLKTTVVAAEILNTKYF